MSLVICTIKFNLFHLFYQEIFSTILIMFEYFCKKFSVGKTVRSIFNINYKNLVAIVIIGIINIIYLLLYHYLM